MAASARTRSVCFIATMLSTGKATAEIAESAESFCSRILHAFFQTQPAHRPSTEPAVAFPLRVRDLRTQRSTAESAESFCSRILHAFFQTRSAHRPSQEPAVAFPLCVRDLRNQRSTAEIA